MRNYAYPLTGPDSKQYGSHEYDGDPHHTSDCRHGCGAWMGPSRSGAPVGIDPGGTCPNNPIDGTPLEHGQDANYVIDQRIALLQERAYEAEMRLKSVEPGTLKLAEELGTTRKKLEEMGRIYQELRGFVNRNF